MADVELAVEVPGSVRIGEPFRVRWTLTSASTEEVLIAAPLGPMDVFVLDSDGKYLPMTDEGRRSLNSPPSEIAQKGWGSALVLQPLRPTASEEVDLMPLFQFRPGEYTLEVGTEVRRTDIDHAQRRMPLKLAHMKFTVTP